MLLARLLLGVGALCAVAHANGEYEQGGEVVLYANKVRRLD